MKYLIWSNEHRGWWRANRHGYTTLVQRAAHFSLEDATEIVTKANRHSDKIEEVMVEAPSHEQIAMDLLYPER
jgi:hypothetical protein